MENLQAVQFPVSISKGQFIHGWMRQSSRKNGFQQQVKESGTATAYTVKNLTRRPTYKTVTFMQRTLVSPMQSPWLSAQYL